jgi:phosphate transport system substrate-binding protein
MLPSLPNRVFVNRFARKIPLWGRNTNMRRGGRTLFVMAFTLVSCSSQILPAATPTSQTPTALRLFATTSTLPLLNNLTTAYTRLNPSIRFDVSTGNYDALVERVRNGEAPYFFSNHLPADGEARDLWAAPVGQDGIAVIVHPSNPVPGLTTTELRDIYQGWTTDWKEVGGSDSEIVVVSREDGSGTRAEFESLVMGTRRTTPTAQVAPSSSAMVTSIARTPESIGYVSMSYLNSSVRALEIDGVLPTHNNIYDNTYPLRSIIYVVGLQEPERDYRAFIAWVQSQEGQAIVARTHAPLRR